MSNTDSLFYKYNPEKRNIFIEIHKGRSNFVMEMFLGIFMIFASHASAIVEVFLRRRFGERYITLAQSIGLFLAIIILYSWADNIFDGQLDSPFLLIFAFVFLGFSIWHRLEIKRYGTTYDFKRFSLSDGEIAPFWWKIIGKKYLGIKVTSYLVHVLLEPAIPVVIGFLLMSNKYTYTLGALLFLCGIIFGFRNFSKAQQGRNWVLDNIDKKISNEMKYDVFIGRKPKNDTKGVYLPIELPEDEETRQALYKAVDSSFNEGEDIWVNDFLGESSGGSESGGGQEGHGLSNGGDVSGGK